MASVVNDGTLVRGSIKPSINGVNYIFLNFEDDGAQPRSENDYDENGKPLAASHAEDFQMISGVIRARSDQVAPPKFVTFSYDGKNYYIKSRRYTGSTEGLKEYAVEIQEQIAASLVTS
jgi:hypothetical protein